MRTKEHDSYMLTDKTIPHFSRSFSRPQQIFIVSLAFILLASLLALGSIIFHTENLPSNLWLSYVSIFLAGAILALISVQIIRKAFLSNIRLNQQLCVHRRREGDIRENIENLRIMLDNTPLSFVLLDTQMRVKSWNALSEQQALTLAGIQLKKSLSALAVVEPHNHEKFLAVFAKVLAGTAHSTEYSFTTQQGEKITQEWRYTPVTNHAGKVIAVCVMIADITERVKAEAGWRESDQVFREIAGNLNEMLWVRDRKTRKIIYASPSYTHLYGRPVQSLLDDPDDFIEAIHHEDVPWVKAESKLNAENKKPYNVEYRVVQPNGQVRWIWARSYRLYNKEGVPYRSVGIAEDITHFKEAEKQAGELMLERERANLLTSFIRDISHEFRTPLATMKSGLHLLEFSTKEEQRKDRIERINKQIDTILQLIEDLVTMTRLDSLQTVELQRGSLKDVLQAVAFSQKEEAIKKGIDLTVEIGDLPPIYADTDRLRQAITNLLSNAVRYTSSGGNVSITASFIEDNFVIKVSDTGVGIDSESLPHIYNSFYRVDAARSTAGSGLGLTVAKRIIELQGGTISVESQENIGSTFTVTLPNHASAKEPDTLSL